MAEAAIRLLEQGKSMTRDNFYRTRAGAIRRLCGAPFPRLLEMAADRRNAVVAAGRNADQAGVVALRCLRRWRQYDRR